MKILRGSKMACQPGVSIRPNKKIPKMRLDGVLASTKPNDQLKQKQRK